MLPKIFLLLLLIALGACAERAPEPATTEIVVTDDASRTVHLKQPATRVVSLMPTVTDLLIAMGATDRLIARTDFDTDPRLARLPSLGGGLTPSVEWLASQKPDLVISWPDHGTRSLVDQLATVGVPVYSARSESIDDSYRIVTNLGTLLGMKTQADSLRRNLRAALDSVRARTRVRAPVAVAYVVGIDPPMVAAAGTFIDELVTIAGGRNVFPDLQLWPQVSLEELVQRDPAVIVLANNDSVDALAQLRTLPGWRELTAVKQGRVHRVSPYLFNRSGPLMPNAARELAQFFHAQ